MKTLCLLPPITEDGVMTLVCVKELVTLNLFNNIIFDRCLEAFAPPQPAKY